MRIIQSRIRTTIFIFIALLIPLKVVAQQISNEQQTSGNKCKVFIINDSHGFWYSAGTGVIDTKIDQEQYGNIVVGDYIEIETDMGNRDFIFEHWDMCSFSSVHTVTLNPGTNYLIVKAKPTSHKIELCNTPPENFENRFHKRGENCKTGISQISSFTESKLNSKIRTDLNRIRLYKGGNEYKTDSIFVEWLSKNGS